MIPNYLDENLTEQLSLSTLIIKKTNMIPNYIKTAKGKIIHNPKYLDECQERSKKSKDVYKISMAAKKLKGMFDKRRRIKEANRVVGESIVNIQAVAGLNVKNKLQRAAELLLNMFSKHKKKDKIIDQILQNTRKTRFFPIFSAAKKLLTKLQIKGTRNMKEKVIKKILETIINKPKEKIMDKDASRLCLYLKEILEGTDEELVDAAYILISEYMPQISKKVRDEITPGMVVHDL